MSRLDHLHEAMVAVGVPPGLTGIRLDKGLFGSTYLTSKEKGLYLWGPTGLQKTRAAIGIVARRLALAAEAVPESQDEWWVRVRFTTVADLVEDIRRVFTTEERDEAGAIAAWGGRYDLIIDDLGAENRTPYNSATLARVLDHRIGLARRGVTVVTSNYSLADIGKMYADERRISRRLKDLCIEHPIRAALTTTEAA